MKLIDPYIEIMSPIDGQAIMKLLELAGRTCYKSEDLIKTDSCDRFVGAILSKHHESVIEHASITVKFIGSRAMSHQLVRHRIASYSQESQRYCNYTRDKFGGDIIFIKPRKYDGWSTDTQEVFDDALSVAESNYNYLVQDCKLQPQDARDVLPNACKTEVVVTMNLRSWRHFFKMRTDKHAQDEIRYLANLVLTEFKKELPVIFGDIL